MMQESPRPAVHRRRRIPKRQHDPIRRDGPVPGYHYAERFLALRSLDPGHLAENTLQHDPGGRRALGLVEHFLKVLPVHRPRHEILGIRIGMRLAHEAQEMQRITWMDRQPSRRDIEYVGHVVRGVGDPAADVRTALNQDDIRGPEGWTPEQIGRENAAAKSRSDDDEGLVHVLEMLPYRGRIQGPGHR
jgi:hypothetical protein